MKTLKTIRDFIKLTRFFFNESFRYMSGHNPTETIKDFPGAYIKFMSLTMKDVREYYEREER